MSVTWREVKQTLQSIGGDKLDDFAYYLTEQGDFKPIDIFLVDIDEIADTRLVAMPIETPNQS